MTTLAADPARIRELLPENQPSLDQLLQDPVNSLADDTVNQPEAAATPVNFPHVTRINRPLSDRLSLKMRQVLLWCAEWTQTAGRCADASWWTQVPRRGYLWSGVGDRAPERVPVSWLVSRQIAAGQRAPIVRASLSRTLRRLWRHGLVELHQHWDETLTSKRQRFLQQVEAAEANPEGEYRQALAWANALRRPSDHRDPWGSSSALLARMRERAARPEFRATVVSLTPAGWTVLGDEG